MDAGESAGFQARVGKRLFDKVRRNFFAHPGLQFAHPAICNDCPACPPLYTRTDIECREIIVKMWKIANPLSYISSDLALQLGLVIPTVSLWLQVKVGPYAIVMNKQHWRTTVPRTQNAHHYTFYRVMY